MAKTHLDRYSRSAYEYRKNALNRILEHPSSKSKGDLQTMAEYEDYLEEHGEAYLGDIKETEND